MNFKQAIKEIEEAILEEKTVNISAVAHEPVAHESNTHEPAIHVPEQLINQLTLKTTPISEIIITFNESKAFLREIFNQRRSILDRFNYGGIGYDFLTVLWRIVTPEQQKAMYSTLMKEFIEDEREYIGSLIVSINMSLYLFQVFFYLKHHNSFLFQYENLFWTILLPEWAIAVCVRKFRRCKEKILQQIQKDDMDEVHGDSSFDI